MKLRNWQQEAVAAALKKFETPYSHFLCLATPGAGKTVMASALADILLKTGKVDLVLCFSPSTVVANDFRIELESITKKRFCGSLGATGSSLTYQSMFHLDEQFWSLLTTFRVFVIFDEIHHCAGQHHSHSNAWGEQILHNIQGKALYTIALTGTPWRSDPIPISLAHYGGVDSNIQVDYRYTLFRAISEGVCRTPRIIALDNELITVIAQGKRTPYSSITQLIDEGELSYLSLLQHETVITQILRQGIRKLNNERSTADDAGGLIVAASIAHAHQIHCILTKLGETAEIVSYQHVMPDQRIQNFKLSKQKWIISIGMISEGTNIPRLKVCCYLTIVTTELYFRQVLGRILRAQHSSIEMGHFFMPAHPLLLEYAARLADELPHHAVLIESQKRSITYESTGDIDSIGHQDYHSNAIISISETDTIATQTTDTKTNPFLRPHLREIDSFGRFKQQVYEL